VSEHQGFASKDLKRRPFRSALVLVSLTSVVATTTFIFLFGNALLDVSSLTLGSSLTSSLGTFFATFIWAILLLVFVLGVVVVSSTVSLEMVTRRRDIGLMKAMGTLLDTIFDYFMAQSVIVLLAGIVLGIGLGTVFYMLGMIWLGTVVPGAVFTMQFPLLQIGVIAALYIIAGYYSSQKPIYDTVMEPPSRALNPEVGMKVQRSGFMDSFGLAFRIATKNTGRRVKGTRRTILSLFLSFTVASMLWMGGGIVETTSESYVIRSMGSDVVAIGSPDLLAQYYSAYSLYGTPLNDTFTHVDSEDIIPVALFAELEGLLGVRRVESRLVVYSSVRTEAVSVYNELIEDYVLVGEDRSGAALLVGVDWGATISDWYYEGAAAIEQDQVWVGGALAEDLFEDPLIQSLYLTHGSEVETLDIEALAFDILNGGMMAIMDRGLLQDYWGVAGSNLALVQLEEYDQSLIADIEEIANSYGFSIYRQQDLLTENLSAIAAVWSLLNPLAIMALLSAFLGLMNYLLVSVFGRLRDYVIMRSVGAKPTFIATVMIAEGFDVGIRAAIPALAVAALLSIYILIPEAAVPSLAYLPLSLVSIFLALIAVTVVSAIPVYFFFRGRNDLRVSEFAS
jgi:ABC-type antimicrobial peptide transport system permease subunit